MESKAKFGTWEGICIATLAIISKILYTSTSVIVKRGGTSAWAATLVSCIVSLTAFLIIFQLSNRFPKKNMPEIMNIVLGKFLGGMVNFAFTFYIMFYVSANLREFVEMIKTYNFPMTQPSVIAGTFILVVAIVAYKGIENIGRLSYISFLPIILGILLILLLAYSNYQFDSLKPYFGYGIKNTVKIGVLRSAAYEEVIMLVNIATCFNDIKDMKKAGIISILISGFLFSICIMMYIMAFGYSQGSENLSGMFQLSRLIYFNRYFQRVDAVFLFMWVISSFIVGSVTFYSSVTVFARGFNIPNYKPLIPSFAFLIFVMTFVPRNIVEVTSVYITFVRQYSAPFVFGVPILVYFIALLRRKKES